MDTQNLKTLYKNDYKKFYTDITNILNNVNRLYIEEKYDDSLFLVEHKLNEYIKGLKESLTDLYFLKKFGE